MTSSDSFRSLVVGVDEGRRSQHALRAALDLQERLGADLRLVHAVQLVSPVPFVSGPGAAEQAELLAAAHAAQVEQLAPVLREAGRADDELETLLEVLPGNPGKVLLDACERRAADLIVLGPHERQSLFDFGSTARSILSHSAHAVWVQKEAPTEIRRILVAVDLSPDSRRVMERVRSLAKKLEAEVCVLHCFPPPVFAYPSVSGYPMSGPTYVVDNMREESRREFARFLSGFDWEGVQVTEVFREGDPTDEILSQAETADLIALGTHGHSGLSAAVLGNVAYTVLRRATKPVLAIRQPDREWLI